VLGLAPKPIPVASGATHDRLDTPTCLWLCQRLIMASIHPARPICAAAWQPVPCSGAGLEAELLLETVFRITLSLRRISSLQRAAGRSCIASVHRQGYTLFQFPLGVYMARSTRVRLVHLPSRDFASAWLARLPRPRPEAGGPRASWSLPSTAQRASWATGDALDAASSWPSPLTAFLCQPPAALRRPAAPWLSSCSWSGCDA
jgi:hypothetical protein